MRKIGNKLSRNTYAPFLQKMALPALIAMTLSAPGHAAVMPGDVVVVDSSAGTDDRGALFHVKTRTGARRLLSDFGNDAQGPAGMTPTAAVFETMDSILAVDINGGTALRGAVYRIDAMTGQRSLVSDMGAAEQGPLGSNPSGVAVESSGKLLVVDPSAGDADHRGRLFRVDPEAGNRMVVSDFSNAAQGMPGFTPVGVAVESTGMILVTDANLTPGAAGTLYRIDPHTGDRMVLSDFADSAQGPLGMDPAGVAVEAAGTILVSDPGNRLLGSGGTIFRIDPATGNRSIVSDFDDLNQGLAGGMPVGFAVDAAGRIVVADADISTSGEENGALLRVDPKTGNRSIVSNFGDPLEGPTGNDPTGVAVVPGNLFKLLNIKVKYDETRQLLWVRGQLALNKRSDGLGLLREMIRVKLGSVTQFFPTHLCAILSKQAVKCEGTIGETRGSILVRPLAKNKFGFYLVASGPGVPNLKKALPLSIAIGNDAGSTLINMKQKRR